MIHLIAKSAVKRVLAGGHCGLHLSSYAASAGTRALTPFDVSVATGVQVQGLSMAVIGWRKMMSTVAAPEQEPSSTTPSVVEKDKSNELPTKKVEKGEVVVSSYWGVSRPKIAREDGTEWPWNCFMPWETYAADLSIDLSKHHVPKTFIDKVAYRTVKLLRIPTDLFFQRRYGCRAMMLETVVYRIF